MNPRLVGRILATLLLGALFGLYMHSDQTKWNQLGRQAYLDHETEDFDSNMANHQSKPVQIIGATIAAGVLLGAYELVALAFFRSFQEPVPRHRKPPTHPAASFLSLRLTPL